MVAGDCGGTSSDYSGGMIEAEDVDWDEFDEAGDELDEPTEDQGEPSEDLED